MSSILGSFKNTAALQNNQNYKVVLIPYTDIKEAEINRTLKHIDELAEDIKNDGLEQPLVVRKIHHDQYRYELVAGHRRFNAICKNIQDGDTTYRSIPCVIKNYDDEEEAHRRKLMNNLNIEGYSNGEKLEAIEWLIDYYKRKKAEKGTEMPGRVRELVAQASGLKPTQVGTYQKVIDHAIPEVKEKIHAGELAINAAVELADMPEEDQIMFIQENDGDITLKTVKEYQGMITDNTSDNVSVTDTTEDDINDLYEMDPEDDLPEETEVDYGKNTILGCISRIDYNMELLEEKMQCTEYRKYLPYLEKAKKQIKEMLLTLHEDLKEYPGGNELTTMIKRILDRSDKK